MTPIKAIYDNGGKTLDRYTIYLDDSFYINGKKFYNLLATSETGSGFCNHSHGKLGRHNGKKITFDQLPKEIQQICNNYEYYEKNF